MIASGDLSNRCRPAELEEAKALLDRLPAPTLAVPGNHDIPYTLPGARHAPVGAVRGRLRHHRPGSPHRERRRLRAQLGPPVAASGRPARSAAPRRRVGPILADAPAGALRDRRLPPPPRRRALARLAEVPAQAPRHGARGRSRPPEPSSSSAGTSTRARPSSGTRSRRSTTTTARSLVLATAPGFGRPRPHRLGEANGLHVVRWTADEIEIETRIWRRRRARLDAAACRTSAHAPCSRCRSGAADA